jgi:AAA+ ATPase superfamily predicted ATPase
MKQVNRLIGRKMESGLLIEYSQKPTAQLVCVYGRRRIGKSFLIEKVFQDKNFLQFEGLENEHTDVQIKNFTHDLARQTGNKILFHAKVYEWDQILDEFTKYLQQQKEHTVILFDEFQWMAAQKSLLVSLFKKYWDQYWSKCNVTIILCGSISSFMVKKVIKSKALYGRINLELNIGPLSWSDCCQFLPKRNEQEVFKYYLTFGGVPKYWTLLSPHKSYQQNMEALFLQKQSYLLNDYEKIFYSQFKEPKTYELIVKALSDGPLNLDEIALKIKKTSSGSVKTYLDNLLSAGFVLSYFPYDKKENSKLKKYKISDEYLRYYFKFILANKSQILNNSNHKPLFSRLIESNWEIWSGFALENFCLKNAMSLAEVMGFDTYVDSFGPYFQRADAKSSARGSGFQIDLIFKRTDKVITVCEIKFYQKPVTAKVIADVEKKIQLLDIPRGFSVEKALITINGADQGLVDSQYFDHILELKNFL